MSEITQLDRIEAAMLRREFQPTTEAPRREFLSVEEAAIFVGLSRQQLDTWKKDGGGPAVHRVGRRVLYSVEDLRVFMAQRRATPLA